MGLRLAACLLLPVVLACLTACGPTRGGQVSAAAGGPPAGADSADAANSYGGLVPLPDAADPVEFTVFVRDPGMISAGDNPVIDKITELTGVTLHYEFLVGDLDQKLRVMTAGGDYPDAIFAGDSTAKLIQAGAFIHLEEEIPRYPNLNALYGQVLQYMKRADGHIHTLELFGTLKGDVTQPAPIFESKRGFFIQKAVLEEAGYPTVGTVEEYFALIEDYKARHPMIEGAQTIGFELLSDGWRNWALVNPAQHLLGAGNDGLLYVNPTTLATSFYQAGDTAYRYYKALNDAYHKGLIAPSTLTQSYEQYLSHLSTGAVLGFFDQNWNFASAVGLLKADGKFNRTYVSLPLTDGAARAGYIDKPSGIPTGVNGIGITVNCKAPARLLRFYDWLLQREVQDYLQWGEENVDWTATGDGGKALTAQRRAVLYDDAQKRDLTGYLVWYYAPKWQGIYTADGMPTGPEESAAEYLEAQSAYDRQFLEGYNIQYPAQLHPRPAERPQYYPIWAMTLEDGGPANISEKKIKDAVAKYYPRLILAADEAEYDAIWEAFKDEFYGIDLAAYRDEIDRQITQLMDR